MSTDLALIEEHPETLFAGATPAEVIAAATQAANALHDVIRAKNLYTLISGREHIDLTGWQTCGAIVGVYAVRDGGVMQLPWPPASIVADPPPDPGREPPRAAPQWSAWRIAKDRVDLHATAQRMFAARDAGLAYGFAVAYKAVKDGHEVGWGEGRCTRAESNWTLRDDYALAGMASARGQSRALRSPLGFVASLAGYSATPAEEVPSAPLYGPEVDDAEEREAAQIIQKLHPSVDGFALVNLFKNTLGVSHLPVAAVRMVAAIQWGISTGETDGNVRDEPSGETSDE